MRHYTLFELQQFEAYPILKHVSKLSDAEIQIFFNTPAGQRGAKIPNKVVRRVAEPKAPTPKPIIVFTPKAPTPQIISTQKCPSVDMDSVRDMALVNMAKTWTYRGRSFNLNDMGWKFEFNDRKTANGMCYSNRRRIYLSRYVIENSVRKMSGWENTMVHEIAHAINNHIGGRGHDWQWRDIFLSFGGTGDRCSKDVRFEDLVANPISKYTTVCPNGHTRPMHKRSRVIEQGRRACSTCCNEHNYGRFSKEYTLKQIQNW